MKTIRQKITLPLVWVAVILPLAVLLLFNVFFRIYMVQSAGADLTMTAEAMQVQLRQQADDTEPASGDPATPKILASLANLRSVIKASRMTADMDLVLFGRDDRLLFPRAAAEDGLSSRVLNRLKLLVRKGLETDRVKSVRTVGGQYLYVSFPLAASAPDTSPVVVLVSRLSYTSGTLLFVNLLLLAVLLAGAIASILLSVRVARRITDPLLRLRNFADRISRGGFEEETPDRTILEVAELYEQMNRMASRLSLADNAQKTFLQNASHELRTPLMVIQGYAEGLQSGILKDTGKAASVIGDESRRLTRLVESLLTLSRIENPAGRLNLQPLNLPDLLSDHVQRIQAIAEKEGKTVLFQPGTIRIEVTADEELLAQAVTNILANGVRYARETILIRVSVNSGEACIAILDDGPGIAAEDLPRLFDRFYKGKKGQFGLGLAIAHSAISALHGRLTASNAPSGGAVFQIFLPLVKSVTES